MCEGRKGGLIYKNKCIRSCKNYNHFAYKKITFSLKNVLTFDFYTDILLCDSQFVFNVHAIDRSILDLFSANQHGYG